MYLRIMVVLLGVLLAVKAGAADEMKALPTPDWVVAVQFDAEALKATKSDEAGLSFVLSSEQHNFSLKSPQSYFRYVTRVNSLGAINQAPAVTIAYFPGYQLLRLHAFALWREGEKIDLAKNSSYQISRRATEGSTPEARSMELAIYINDLRRGDLIEVAYSTEGQRSDFLDRIMGGFVSAYEVPTGSVYRRIITGNKTNLQYRLMGGHRPPEIKENGNITEYIWNSEDVEANKVELGAPIWHVQWPMVEFVDFADWNDVARWGRDHFKLKKRAAKAVRAKSKELRGSVAESVEYLRAVLGFMQSEIRYVGEDLGRSGYQPFTPVQTLKRRFGDCKDQTMLMLSLLRQEGIESWAVLVSNNWRGAVDKRLPSPMAFDHSIVLAVVEGQEYWLDPTLSLEKETPTSLLPVEHLRALVLREDESSLTTIPNPFEDAKDFTLEWTYLFDALEGVREPGKLKSDRLFRGEGASAIINTIDKIGFRKAIENEDQILRKNIDGLEPLGNQGNLDSLADGTLMIQRNYTIPRAWEFNRYDERWELGYKAYHISRILRQYRIASLKRKTPLALYFPFKVREEIAFRFPKDWPVYAVEVNIDNPYFRFRANSYYENGTAKVEYQLEILDDHVPIDQLDQFREDIEKATDDLSYYVFFDAPFRPSQEEDIRGVIEHNIGLGLHPPELAEPIDMQ